MAFHHGLAANKNRPAGSSEASEPYLGSKRGQSQALWMVSGALIRCQSPSSSIPQLGGGLEAHVRANITSQGLPGSAIAPVILHPQQQTQAKRTTPTASGFNWRVSWGRLVSYLQYGEALPMGFCGSQVEDGICLRRSLLIRVWHQHGVDPFVISGPPGRSWR